ncbi:ribonucleoside-diphosphate reductase subunit alpha [Aliarcobacter cryaerophilus]|uniref:Ribonucleoside-diphosphate reductase n=1 Tax=Arcobacter cryaerophilus gv. pseudocryaerophilus TaxID=2933791 RepID=A0AAU0P4B4_9BACT|nr:ribonucleoside-diphosphate reductase subunit alpha [Aliarcobacter cryaerophilus]WPD03854.1 ribonucleoside-diphosphate reductase subunit alpha [Arcobacter sp. DSM 115972]MCT7433546.1 ribonucleoside-diphosphate reductase subunit alpha [Aliarcobacter cryaerophilus]MCT7470317.1 ribonucleoside-diphosphate reductase subunit alpha [Aliarcobacter cryaerophilus]MCT7488091.1 ribonucleoside-diphosphate reductase subunit alpha [Aliarcobacter cryaerophilus]MCT7497981.1 ribonucleoside-diphosphate reducta
MTIMIQKRNGRKEVLDITKIQKMTIEATAGLEGVSQSELELDSHIKFIDGMNSSDIQDALIKTAVEKIDIDVPNWTFVAARLFLYDLYHRVGIATYGVKGEAYRHLKEYINFGIEAGRIIPNLANGYDLDDLNSYIDPSRDFLFNYLGIKTLYDRYLIKNSKGEPIELPQQMFMAIAMFLAQNEEKKQEKAKEFYDVISKFEVMLATPTLSNARTNRHQLSSCYIGSSPDNIEGIFDGYKEMALLSKYGGGIGWDWNQIRSLGGSIDGHKSAAGGTVPFLKITNDIAIAVDQLGTRKGAIAVYLEPWHMDIMDFIDLKKNSGEERRRAHDLFPALWISDLFMERVLEDSHWTLFDPVEVKDLSEYFGEEFTAKYIAYENNDNITKNRIKAKDLWKKILTSYFESGSPFLCFKDSANKANPNQHAGHIRSSNLCTEIFQNTNPNHYKIKIEFEDGTIKTFEEEDLVIVDGGITKKANKVTALDSINGKKIFIVEKQKIDGDTAVCNLASINLSRINTSEDIKRVVPIAVNMLDNVIDLNFYPLRKVKATNLKSRAIGLGVMGEAEMLASNKISWGSNEHFKKIDEIMEYISYNTILASSNLAIEKGSYPTFDGSNWSKGIMPHDHTPQAVNAIVNKDLFDNSCDWDFLREKVKKDGMRNGYLMAIAPTSSISILVGTTQAIEPVYKRKWFEENLSGLIPVVAPKLSPDTWSFYTPAFEIDQLQVVKAAAIRQKWIDQGQSTNIFMSLDKASGKYLHEIYTLAWKLGLKSTYYLRSQSPEAKNDVEDRSMECAGCQ